jgi:hypothetical protein
MLLSRQENAGRNHNIQITNRCFEKVAQFKYLSTTVTNQKLIHQEITSRLFSGNATIKFRTFCLLELLLKIKIDKIIILPVVLHGFSDIRGRM